MAKAHPVEIGRHQFRRKSDALGFLKTMLNRYCPGGQVGEEDAEFLEMALSRHPNASVKIGIGVERFEVRSADYGTQCFWVIRLDGSEERFSYKKCV